MHIVYENAYEVFYLLSYLCPVNLSNYYSFYTNALVSFDYNAMLLDSAQKDAIVSNVASVNNVANWVRNYFIYVGSKISFSAVCPKYIIEFVNECTLISTPNFMKPTQIIKVYLPED